MLTEEAQAEYLENMGELCPYCGSDDITTGVFVTEYDGLPMQGMAMQKVTCGACKRSWQNMFTLVAIEEAAES